MTMIRRCEKERIESSKTIRRRFWKYVRCPDDMNTDECWVWIGADSGGYGKLRVDPSGKLFAHRISWHICRGEIEEGKLVLHKCDNPSCVNPTHLFLGTYLDNNRDR